MNYRLHNAKESNEKVSLTGAFKRIWPFLATEKKSLIIAAVALVVNSSLNLLAPVIVGHAVDTSIQAHDFPGVIRYAVILFALYVVVFFSSFIQTRAMGTVGQRVLFRLRNTIFTKLQSLPIAFFNQNKSGDLISRINNDTDKLSQFFAGVLVQFMANLFSMLGAGIFLVSLNPRLGGASLIPAAVLLFVTRLLSPWIKRKNAESLQALGTMSGEVQESLNNFKVIVAFHRRDYFRERFEEVNQKNQHASLRAGIANNTFTPIYTFCSSAAQLIVFGYGLMLVAAGQFTIGLLVSFLLYVSRFYDPVRQLASLWTSLQSALAAWDRVSAILSLESDMVTLPANPSVAGAPVLAFHHVSFRYPDSGDVLKHISFELERGKIYALVGPTGGGKTTTASLMARLYDATEGTVLLDGRDIRSYTEEERTRKIGFILQEPFLFTGTVRDNLVYGNAEYLNATTEHVGELLKANGLDGLLARFEKGLETSVTAGGDSISLGQKQIIAFIRAVLRRPEILILDEATANIDTVTEQLLEEVLKKLPATTTRVIIAHRLNTIENADEIFFVNAGEVTRAGSMEHAVEMLMHGKRAS